jgi:hypothetical protein
MRPNDKLVVEHLVKSLEELKREDEQKKPAEYTKENSRNETCGRSTR